MRRAADQGEEAGDRVDAVNGLPPLPRLGEGPSRLEPRFFQQTPDLRQLGAGLRHQPDLGPLLIQLAFLDSANRVQTAKVAVPVEQLGQAFDHRRFGYDLFHASSFDRRAHFAYHY